MLQVSNAHDIAAGVQVVATDCYLANTHLHIRHITSLLCPPTLHYQGLTHCPGQKQSSSQKLLHCYSFLPGPVTRAGGGVMVSRAGGGHIYTSHHQNR